MATGVEPEGSGALGWRAAWSQRRFRVRFALAVAAFVLSLVVLARVVDQVESRPGVVLEDPVLARIAPRDFTAPTFVLIYGGILLAAFALARRPRALGRALEAYATLVVLRVATMAATPLEPPEGILPLRDPLTEAFGGGHALTRDLFFSGHVATLFLLGLCCGRGAARALLLGASVVVGVLTLWQHAHYTVDVLVAPMAAVAALALVRARDRAPAEDGA